MKILLAVAVLLAFFPKSQAQTTESCQLSVVADGSVKLDQCVPALTAPFTLTVAAQSAASRGASAPSSADSPTAKFFGRQPVLRQDRALDWAGEREWSAGADFVFLYG